MSKPNTRGTHLNMEKLGEEATEQLIKRVCQSFSNQLETTFNQKFDELNRKLDYLSKTFTKLDETVTANSEPIKTLKNKCCHYDQFMKKNCLIMHGLQESNGENVMELICSVIETKLNISCTNADIDSAYRFGQFSAERNTRPVRITFLSNNMKSQVLKNKKALKGTGILIFEDLTTEQYALFMKAKKKFGRDVWTVGGKVYALKNGNRCLINNEDDL